MNEFLASFRADPGDFYTGRVDPATFANADGWHGGSTGQAEVQPDGQSTLSWASTIPYRDEGFQWPPHETLAALPTETGPRSFRGRHSNYNVTVRALFGREQPTQEQLDRAQAEIDRLELPEWPDWVSATSAER